METRDVPPMSEDWPRLTNHIGRRLVHRDHLPCEQIVGGRWDGFYRAPQWAITLSTIVEEEQYKATHQHPVLRFAYWDAMLVRARSDHAYGQAVACAWETGGAEAIMHMVPIRPGKEQQYAQALADHEALRDYAEQCATYPGDIEGDDRL